MKPFLRYVLILGILSFLLGLFGPTVIHRFSSRARFTPPDLGEHTADPGYGSEKYGPDWDDSDIDKPIDTE